MSSGREAVGGNIEPAGRCGDGDLFVELGRACSDEAPAAAKPATCGSCSVSAGNCTTSRLLCRFFLFLRSPLYHGRYQAMRSVRLAQADIRLPTIERSPLFVHAETLSCESPTMSYRTVLKFCGAFRSFMVVCVVTPISVLFCADILLLMLGIQARFFSGLTLSQTPFFNYLFPVFVLCGVFMLFGRSYRVLRAVTKTCFRKMVKKIL